MIKIDLRKIILEGLENYDFTKNQKSQLFEFLSDPKNKNVLRILLKCKWSISIETAIEMAFKESEKYSYIDEFDCTPFFSSDIKDDDNFFKDLIAWVLVGWFLKDLLKDDEDFWGEKQKQKFKPEKPY